MFQLVFISVGAVRRERYYNSSHIPSSALPTPAWESTPVILLLQEKYFEQLFAFLETLDKLLAASAKHNFKGFGPLNLGMLEQEQTQMDFQESAEDRESTGKSLEDVEKWQSQDSWNRLENRVEYLCYIIWELLCLLPTNQTLLNNLKYFGNDSETVQSDSNPADEQCNVQWSDLLQPKYPHKLLYSLQIIDFVHSASKDDSGLCSNDSQLSSDDEVSDVEDEAASKPREMPVATWGSRFVEFGGLKHLYYILMLGHLEANECVPWTQWQQECLAHLLKIVCEFGTMKVANEDDEDDVFDSSEHGIRLPQIQRRDGQFRVRYKSTDKEEVICIRCLSHNMVSIMDMEPLMDKLLSISHEATLPVHGSQNRICGGEGTLIFN